MSFYLRVPGKMSSQQAKSLAMLYLFLSAEQRISDEAFSLFERIGSSYEGFDEAKGTIVGECEKLLLQQSDGKNRLEMVQAQLSTKEEDTRVFVSRDEKNKKFVLSLFLNAIYQDQGKLFSDTKAALVEIWRSEMKIDESVFIEMKDTAITLADLAEYQKWLLTGNNTQEYLAEIEKNRQELNSQLSNLIALG